MAAETILSRLESLKQWSDFSEGYSSTEAQLNACMLNSDGLVYTAAQMTELTGECWKLAAQLYLLCRLQRQVQ